MPAEVGLVELTAKIAERLRRETDAPKPMLTQIETVILDPEPTTIDPTDPIDQRALLIAFTCFAARRTRAGKPRADRQVKKDFDAFAAKYRWAMPARSIETGMRRAMKAATVQAKPATRTEIACLLGYTYFELSGSNPSARRGQQSPFRRLVVDVFALAGIGGAVNAAEHACRANRWAKINTYLPDCG
jgi:hypothetical protein